MGQTNSIASLLILVAIVALVSRRSMRDALIDGIQAIAEHFRGGGPPTPMHPSPADDRALLRRRSHTHATQIHAKQVD
jgi:hypothetical protein